MSLKDLYLKVNYNTAEDNVAIDFFNPALKEAILYKRAVAFFNSKSLLELVDGIIGLVNNNGKIKLLISPVLEEKDIEAIRLGYKSRQKALEDKVVEAMGTSNIEELDKYRLLSWLIYKQILDIKIIYRCDNLMGLFHDKLGILYDDCENTICFHGSNNETAQAINNNFESFDVFVSWDDRDKLRIELKEDQFDKLWGNKNDVWKAFEISEDFRIKLMKYKIGEDPFIHFDNFNSSANLIEVTKTDSFPRIPPSLVLREYQLEAINTWFKNNGMGIFEMATGTGKTVTSLAAITRLMNHYYEKGFSIGLIVVLPYKVLLEQWENELKNFCILPISCYESFLNWRDSLDRNISLFNSGSQKSICIITTNTTFKSSKFQERLKSIKNDYILCIDELHNFASEKSIKCLPAGAKYRLGLSATLNNEFRQLQLDKLKGFFGTGVIFQFSLEKAIKEGFLTKYYYNPIFVELNDEEKSEYYSLSKTIANLINKLDIDDEKIQALFRKRSRIISSAESKLHKLKELEPIFKDTYNNIFYCGDRIESNERFIEKVNRILSHDIGLKTHTFTSNETKEEREQLLEDFKNQKLQALTAIRCLDEGIDIPGLRRAFILSSGSNPKEFIQRRGRILRKSKNKEYAEIYDFVVVPTLDKGLLKTLDKDILENEKKIISKELVRFKEFADLSIEPQTAYRKIIEVMEMYN